MNSADLTSLAARAEAGSGEDPDLSFEIGAALGLCGWEPSDDPPGETKWGYGRLRPWLTSLDAVIELIAERLPGWRWQIRTSKAGDWIAVGALAKNGPYARATSREECRARLACFLRALAAQQDRTTDGDKDNG